VLLVGAPTDIANWPIQHFGAWLMSQGLLRMRPKIERYRDDAFWIGQYHDAAMFEVREELAERVAADAKSSFEIVLTTKSGRKVPFPVDVKIDDTWALV
jgi:DNA polymerase I-like protein with 3'-5' exonuclease and polymerase domains